MIAVFFNFYKKFMRRIFFNFVGNCRILWARITGRKWWFVSCDIEVDETSGQGELDSCVVIAKTENEAKEKTIHEMVKSWGVDIDDVYIFDIVQIQDPKTLGDKG